MNKFITPTVTFGIEFKAYYPYPLKGLYKYRGNYYIPPAPPKDMMEQIRNRVSKYLQQKNIRIDSDVRVDISSWPQVLSSLKELISYTKFDLIVDAQNVPPIGTTLESKPKHKRKSKRKENYESYVLSLHASEEQNSDDNEWIQVKNK
jgi:hypothetical protein